MSLSVPEVILADLTALMQTIQPPTYRNAVKHVSQVIPDPNQVTEYPWIAIVLLDGWVESGNDAMTVFREYVTVRIEGYVSSDPNSTTEIESSLKANSESLLHDLRKAVASIMTSKIAESTNRYKMLRRNPIVKLFRPVPWAGLSKAVVGIEFSMWIIAQDSTFSL